MSKCRGTVWGIVYLYSIQEAFLVAQSVKNLPATWETGVQSLGREEPLKEGMVTHSRILA